MRQNDSQAPVSFDTPGDPNQVGGFVGVAVLQEPNELTDEYDTDAAMEMIGKRVVLTTGTVLRESDAGGPVQFKRKVVPFAIADVMFTGVYDLDRRFIYLPRERVQEVIYPDEPEPVADQIQIRLAAGVDPQAAVAMTRGLWAVFAEDELGWGPYTIEATDIETSRHMQGQYVYELRKQMGILLFIFGVVDCTVILLISCIFYMIVRMKRKDIGIMKSCGASSGSVAGLFLGFGVCVGVIGAAVGTVLGYVVTRQVNTLEEWIRVLFGLKLWKSSVYMFSRIPNEVDWPSAGRVVIFAIIAAGVGALIPAIVAARTRPVEILQYE